MEFVVRNGTSTKAKLSLEEHLQLLKKEELEPDVSDGNDVELPAWFCEEKFKRGQEFFKHNYYSIFVSNLCGLIIVLSIPSTLNILKMTKKSSCPASSFTRYLSTIIHMLSWYEGDVTDKNSSLMKSLREVKGKHLRANNQGKTNNVGTISQRDLALTQFGFMGFAVSRPEKFGIKIEDPDDMEGFVHFWKVIGYMIGIQDKYNICRNTATDTKQLCSGILNDVFIPCMKKRRRDFLEMSEHLLNGMWVIVPFLEFELFMNVTYKMCDLEFVTTLHWFGRVIEWIVLCILQTLFTNYYFGQYFRTYFNYQMKYSIAICNSFPFLAYYAFGYKRMKQLEKSH